MSEIDLYHEQQAQEYLDHVRSCTERVNTISEEIAQLRSQLTLSGVSYSEHVSGGMVSKDAIPDGVARMLELIDEYTTCQIECLDEQHTLHDVLMKLGPLEARLVKARWIKDCTWNQVAYSLNYSRSGLCAIRHQALQSVYKHMPPTYKETSKAMN